MPSNRMSPPMTLSFNLSESPVARHFEAGASFPMAWRPGDHEADLREPPSPAERCSKLVLRAWSELARLKVAGSLAKIDTRRAEHGSAPIESLHVECELLHAVSLVLKDDA